MKIQLRFPSVLNSSRTLLGVLLLGHLLGGSTLQAKTVQAVHAKIELVAEKESAYPGDKLNIGVFFELDSGWHIYWRNPGDSGQPPKIEWQLPEKYEVGEIQWPVPDRIEIPPLANYGYEGEILLPASLQVPQEATPGVPVEILGNLRYLICKEVCIPAQAELKLTLPIQASEGKSTSWKSHFDKAEKSLPEKMTLDKENGNAVLFQNALELNVIALEDDQLVQAFPLLEGQVENVPAPRFVKEDQQWKVRWERSDLLTEVPDSFGSVLVFKKKGAIQVHVPLQNQSEKSAPTLVNATPLLASDPISVGVLGTMILFAFLGGALLNLMPCVFPVLSIKVLGFLGEESNDSAALRKHGWFYTAGILVSFWILALVLTVVRAGGTQVGWGFQLQSPVFVSLLGGVLVLFSFSLLGVFEIGSSWMGWGARWSSGRGSRGAFMSGVLATVLATPCTAPLMGPALGFALAQPILIGWLVLTTLAIGLAAPYLLLCYSPRLIQSLPRPGRWMETLKQFLAFPVLGTAIWLYWVLGLQVGLDGGLLVLIGWTFLGGFAWMLGRWPTSPSIRMGTWLLIGITLGVLGYSVHQLSQEEREIPTSQAQGTVSWLKFDPSQIEPLQKQGRPVFVDFTAAWCITCQVNERVVISTSEIQEAFKAKNVALMKGDWTRYDPEISAALEALGRSGVPVYVLYPPGGGEPYLFPEVLTQSLLLEKLQALPSVKSKIGDDL